MLLLQGNAFIGVVMCTHSDMPLHSTAAGKLWLADRLRMDLLRVQEQGWAGAPEETVLGINALSAPIQDHRGELIGMISMLSSIQFISRQPSRVLIDAVKAAALAISNQLKL